MKVYILEQTWETEYNGKDFVVIGIYDSLEKAQNKLKEIYEEDLAWARDYDFGTKEDCEKNEGYYEMNEYNIQDKSSYVAFNDYMNSSYNEIIEKEVE